MATAKPAQASGDAKMRCRTRCGARAHIALKRVARTIVKRDANAGVAVISRMRNGVLPLHLYRSAPLVDLYGLLNCVESSLVSFPASPVGEVASVAEGCELRAARVAGVWPRNGDGHDAVPSRARHERCCDRCFAGWRGHCSPTKDGVFSCEECPSAAVPTVV